MKYFYLLILFFGLVQCQPSTTDSTDSTTSSGTTIQDTQAKEKSEQVITRTAYRFGFYNVENLFDIENDPKTEDDAFTPNGEQKWNRERYDKKIGDLAKVIAAMDAPDLLGLCEIENKKVVEDLANDPQLVDANYKVAHRESSYHRGMDVALMYNENSFTVTDIENIKVKIPVSITKQSDYSTRDILHVTGNLVDGQTIHVFVNHWPSRRGGANESSPKREYLAKVLKKAVDKIKADDKDAHIVITGDFNDETNDKSVAEVLKAIPENTDYADELINTSAALDAQDKGSYNYRGDWNMLDQFILSDNFMDGKGLEHKETVIFSEEWMLFKGKSPDRTYGGPNYYGGYSDHLPVYVEVVVR